MKEKRKDKDKKRGKLYSIIFTIVFLVIVGAIIGVYIWQNNKQTEENEDEIAYTDLIQKISNGEVEKIEMTVGSTSIKVKLRDIVYQIRKHLLS